MAIDIQETFQVKAPIDLVWRFLLDPQQVAPCMPGAELDEVIDEHTFHGNVKIKVGAITTRYKGKVQLTKVDEATRTIAMTGEGRETSGGTAKGTMVTVVRTLADGATEVAATATVDLTGKIMQVGRGMIQGVSHQLFLQFVAAVQAHLEPLATAAASAVSSGVAPMTGAAEPVALPRPRAEPREIRIVPIIWNVIWTAIVRFFRRLAGR